MLALLGRLATLLLLGGLALGCGDSEPGSAPEPTDTVTESPTPSTDPEPEPVETTEATEATARCQVLDDAQIERLAGQALGAGRETEAGGLIPVCLWGSLDDVGVQAGVVPADQWARSLPDLVAQLEASGVLDDENREKMEDAAALVASGATIPADEACGLFTELVELNGMPEGSHSTVNLVPSRDDPQAVTGQSCTDGVFGTVVLVRPDLTGSEDEVRAVEEALSSLAVAG